MVARQKTIEDSYPLSPLQEGLLFHGLCAPDAGYYVTQVTCTLSGLNVPAFENAWRHIVGRHAILRTAFVYRNLTKPLQVVGTEGRAPIEHHDLRPLAAPERERQWREFLERDRRRGFDFSKAPLMRLTLFRTGERSFRFAWSHHHILLDGWSLRVLFAEVLAVYRELVAVADAPGAQSIHSAERSFPSIRAALPPTRPYRDYIEWLLRQDTAAAADYWRRTLAGLGAPTVLPLQRRDAATAARTPAEARATLSPAETETLNAFARNHRLTLNTLIQGCLAIVMSRYSGERDIVFGSVVSGRPPELAGHESMVGLFVNTLPVRIAVDEDAGLLAWLGGLQSAQLEARRFEYSALVDVQRASDVPSGTPLFELLYAFENYPAAPGEEQDERVPLGVEIGDYRTYEALNYPLTLLVSPGETLGFKLLYDAAAVDGDAVARLLRHLKTLLLRAADTAAARVAELDPVSDDERRQLLVGLNDTTAAHTARTLHALFEERVRAQPDAIAVVDAHEQVAFRELDERANRLARHLESLGVGPEALVAVCLDRSVDMLTALLATLKAGGTYVPIDPAYPAARSAYILADSGASIVVTDSKLAARLGTHDAAVVRLDADRRDIAAHAPGSGGAAVPPESLAYIIYTSGSTGRPKGVAIEHRSASALLHWARDAFPAEVRGTVLAATSICFDLSVFELFVPLAWGGRVVLARDLLDAAELPAAQGVDLINTVPSVMTELLRMDAVPASVTTVNLAGEPLATRLVDRILGAANVRRVFDLYGPSEDTTYSTWTERAAGRTPTIGGPIANTRVYLLDRMLRLVPPGVPGEICLAGAGLARGYLRRPGATAEKFVPDPFSDTPGARMYRTGDHARWRADGNLEFLGRIDHQVKIRGYRIELGEIEATLVGDDRVADAVVVAHRGSEGDAELAAYVVPAEGCRVGGVELRERLRDRLPASMIPSAFVVLEALPLTPNGKVDRKALPAPGAEAARTGGGRAAPRDTAEEMIAGIMADVLERDGVGVHDDFFDLGGHSLRAVQLVCRIRDCFEVDLPIRDLFEGATVAELAARVAAAKERGGADRLPPVRAEAGGQAAPLTFAQERLWFLEQLSPGNAAYNIAAALRLTTPDRAAGQDPDALRAALRGVAARHRVLESAMTLEAGRPVQRVDETVVLDLPMVDLSEIDAAKRERELERRGAEIAGLPFTLTQAPLLRAALFREDARRHVFVTSMHHAVADGWSLGVMVREISELYRARVSGREPALPPVPVQYADYARWQRSWFTDQLLERELEWWQQTLAGAPDELALPADFPRPPVRRHRGGVHAFVVARSDYEGLRRLSRVRGVTLFMTLLAALDTLLYRYSGQADILVGTPVANRTRPEIEGLIGLFVNTLTVRANLAGDPPFTEALARMRAAVLDALAHQDVPFDRVVERLQPRRSLARTPLFQVLFALQNAPLPAIDLPGLAVESMPVGHDTAKFDLSLAMREREGDLYGVWEYDADLFRPETIERLSRHFERLLGSVVSHPNRRLSQLRLLTDGDIESLLADAGSMERDSPAERIDRLIDARAAAAPDATAVVGTGGQITYGELVRRAERLARRLGAAGVGIEDRVGVALPRSADLVVALLGVLKAGAAYVPLDREYPPERLALIVRDAAPRAIVTDEALGDAWADGTQLVLAGDAQDEAASEAARAAGGESRAAEPDAASAAYVIYTSGSTGQPKGVVVEHAAVVNHMRWLIDALGLGETDRVLQKTPLGFDAAGTEIWAPLMSGGAVVMAAPGGQRDGRYLAAAMRLEQVTLLQLVPSLLRVLVEEPLFGECRSLRHLLCAGEALPTDLAARCAALGLNAPLRNLYGPTEAAIDVSHWPFDPKQPEAGRAAVVPIGRPIANTALYVLDRNGELVPPGAAGELCIGGANLARCYLGQPALTAERFVPNPFGRRPGERLYRSGDRVRVGADGALEYLGRVDRQVKLRGFRIEPEEVEVMLRQHDAVRDAAVVVDRPAGADSGDARLVAYVAAAGTPGTTELRRFLKTRLPEHMIPAVIVSVDALPLAPNGKVDRRALPAPDGSRPDLRAPYAPPRTQTETALAGIWCELLRIERAGLDDDFFDLGGHSLLATQLVFRMRERFDADVPLRTVFETPTLRELAAALEAAAASARTPDLERLVRGGDDLELLLGEIDALPDDEVARLLGGEAR